jgi:MFS family permease
VNDSVQRSHATRDFGLLWFGQTVSEMGSNISGLAIPLIAIDVLKASAFSVSLVAAFQMLPYLLFSLPAGAWIDRVAKRSLLITTDVLRALAVGTIPVAIAMGWLTMAQLWIVGFVTGSLSVFFDIAYQAYLPSLVEGTDLVKGNSKLEITRSGANLISPAMTGILMDAIGAAWTIATDAFSFVASLLTLSAIRTREPALSQPEVKRRIIHDIREGLRFVWTEKRIRQVAFCTSTFNFFGSMAGAIIILFARRDLGLPASRIGVYLALGSVGGMLGAAAASRLNGKFGVGHAIIGGAVLSAIGVYTDPLLTASNAVYLMILGGALTSAGGTIYNVSQVSMRQAICPPRLQGRMNASVRFMVWGTQPLGAAMGGILTGVLSARWTLLIAALGQTAAITFVFSPRVRTIKETPEQVSD